MHKKKLKLKTPSERHVFAIRLLNIFRRQSRDVYYPMTECHSSLRPTNKWKDGDDTDHLYVYSIIVF